MLRLHMLAYQKLWDSMSWLLSKANQQLKQAASGARHATWSCVLAAAPDLCTYTLYLSKRCSYIELVIWAGQVLLITTSHPVHKPSTSKATLKRTSSRPRTRGCGMS